MTNEEDIKRIRGAVDATAVKEGRIQWGSGAQFHVSYKVKGLVGFRGVGGMDVAASTTFGELAAELDAVVGDGQWCDVRVRRVEG